MPHEIPDGQISGPSLGHLSPQGVPMDAFLRAELDRRKEVANRPETIEAAQLDQLVDQFKLARVEPLNSRRLRSAAAA